MSINAYSTGNDDEDQPLDELCRSITNNESFSTDVQLLADRLLEAVEDGDLDATRQ